MGSLKYFVVFALVTMMWTYTYADELTIKGADDEIYHHGSSTSRPTGSPSSGMYRRANRPTEPPITPGYANDGENTTPGMSGSTGPVHYMHG